MSIEREGKEKECIKVGVEAFIIADDKLLLGKRKNVPGDGEWGLPGGHLELGETLSECMKRELQEELGIQARDFKLVALDNNPKNIGGHYIHIGFLVGNFDGSIALKEPEKCEEWRFFPIDNLPENIFSAHRKEIELFKKGLIYEGS